MSGRRSARVGLAVVAAVALLGPPTAVATPPDTPSGPIPEEATPRISTVQVDHPAQLDALSRAGVDVFHDERTAADGAIEVTVAYHPRLTPELRRTGARILSTERAPSQATVLADVAGNGPGAEVDRGERGRPASPGGRDVPELLPRDGSIRVLRADWFTNFSGTFLSIEVLSEAGRTAAITVEPDTGASFELRPFVDADVYLYHRSGDPEPLDAPPGEVLITADDGSQVTVEPTEWVDDEGDGYPAGYQWGFTDEGYVDPVMAQDTIEQLAAEFPDLAEIVDVPYDSPGYQKPAQAWVGTTFSNGWFVKTEQLGHLGGNGKVLEVTADGADQPLAVSWDGTTLSVQLATDAAGAVTSTANEVVVAVNASAAADTLTAYPLGSGSGVATDTGTEQITDGLDAPSTYPRGPFDIKALRIGATRDGSKTGVFHYSMEHAREWVTPLVSLEVAERLLRNYGSDPRTTQLVDELDIFILPIVNPDGSAYALYDDLFKRKNLNDYCDPAVSNPLFDSSRYFIGWTGVDLNRNFSVGSRFDGFDGASGNCASQLYSGPSELSEPESNNETWLFDQHPNIKFAMNTHSSGGYFMWSPAAYIEDGRVPLPRPDLGVESYFFDASRTILERIEEHRGTVVPPGRTGPVIDVLYSAAGNSGDEHYYDDAISPDPEVYAWDFEVGAEQWDGDSWNNPGFFWPDFETEGFDQAMEFANGFLGMLEVAAAWQSDETAPTVTTRPGNGAYRDAITVVFDTSEPASIHYTTDGSRPTLDSPTVGGALRTTTPTLEIDTTTRVRWIAVDASGNVSEPGSARYVIAPARGPGR